VCLKSFPQVPLYIQETELW